MYLLPRLPSFKFKTSVKRRSSQKNSKISDNSQKRKHSTSPTNDSITQLKTSIQNNDYETFRSTMVKKYSNNQLIQLCVLLERNDKKKKKTEKKLNAKYTLSLTNQKVNTKVATQKLVKLLWMKILCKDYRNEILAATGFGILSSMFTASISYKIQSDAKMINHKLEKTHNNISVANKNFDSMEPEFNEYITVLSKKSTFKEIIIVYDNMAKKDLSNVFILFTALIQVLYNKRDKLKATIDGDLKVNENIPNHLTEDNKQYIKDIVNGVNKPLLFHDLIKMYRSGTGGLNLLGNVVNGSAKGMPVLTGAITGYTASEINKMRKKYNTIKKKREAIFLQALQTI